MNRLLNGNEQAYTYYIKEVKLRERRKDSVEDVIKVVQSSIIILEWRGVTEIQ